MEKKWGAVPQQRHKQTLHFGGRGRHLFTNAAPWPPGHFRGAQCGDFGLVPPLESSGTNPVLTTPPCWWGPTGLEWQRRNPTNTLLLSLYLYLPIPTFSPLHTPLHTPLHLSISYTLPSLHSIQFIFIFPSPSRLVYPVPGLMCLQHNCSGLPSCPPLTCLEITQHPSPWQMRWWTVAALSILLSSTIL